MKKVITVLLILGNVSSFAKTTAKPGKTKTIKVIERLPISHTHYDIQPPLLSVVPYNIEKAALISNYSPGIPGDYNFSTKEIERLPTNNINDIVSLVPGAYQSRPGAPVNIFGARTDGNLYIIDGVWAR